MPALNADIGYYIIIQKFHPGSGAVVEERRVGNDFSSLTTAVHWCTQYARGERWALTSSGARHPQGRLRVRALADNKLIREFYTTVNI